MMMHLLERFAGASRARLPAAATGSVPTGPKNPPPPPPTLEFIQIKTARVVRWPGRPGLVAGLSQSL